jgi:hypothetical protein
VKSLHKLAPCSAISCSAGVSPAVRRAFLRQAQDRLSPAAPSFLNRTSAPAI